MRKLRAFFEGGERERREMEEEERDWVWFTEGYFGGFDGGGEGGGGGLLTNL